MDDKAIEALQRSKSEWQWERMYHGRVAESERCQAARKHLESVLMKTQAENRLIAKQLVESRKERDSWREERDNWKKWYTEAEHKRKLAEEKIAKFPTVFNNTITTDTDKINQLTGQLKTSLVENTHLRQRIVEERGKVQE